MGPEVFISQLDANSALVLGYVKALGAGEIGRVPASGWNVLQILEHITLTDRLVAALLLRPSGSFAETTEVVGQDRLRRRMVELRQRKVTAPEMLHPKGTLKGLGDFEKIFLKNRQAVKEGLLSGGIALDNRIHKHPLIGDMTIADWLYFMVHHTERHLEQIKDIVKQRE